MKSPKLTRRRLIGGAAAAALTAAGIYELVDQFVLDEERAGLPPLEGIPEQHLIADPRVLTHEGVKVVEPPLHHQVVTAKLRVGEGRANLVEAQEELERALREIGEDGDSTPAGLSVVVGWGLPYFRRYVPGPVRANFPYDRRATGILGKPTPAVLDAIRFPSDPEDTVLEENDVAILLRSDDRELVAEGSRRLFDELSNVFRMTSVRKGFQGGGFTGEQGLPKQMAVAAGIPGADLIPDGAQLFLGFTSTQRDTQGIQRISNFETLGLADIREDGYFLGGTAMHLSHLFEDLDAWYLDFDFQERVDTTFQPDLRIPAGRQTVPQPPRTAFDSSEVARTFRRDRAIGHGSSIQSSSRLQFDVFGSDNIVYKKGTAIPLRADFNTLDNPFFFSSRPGADAVTDEPRAGLHFISFNPTTDDFNRNRLAMDGRLPDGTRLRLEPRSRAAGINSVLRTTHRQNFLVPPRAHRSFPLAELL